MAALGFYGLYEMFFLICITGTFYSLNWSLIKIQIMLSEKKKVFCFNFVARKSFHSFDGAKCHSPVQLANQHFRTWFNSFGKTTLEREVWRAFNRSCYAMEADNLYYSRLSQDIKNSHDFEHWMVLIPQQWSFILSSGWFTLCAAEFIASCRFSDNKLIFIAISWPVFTQSKF